MRVGFVQFRPIFGDVEGNLSAMERLVSSAEADLLVLPELATTGYAFTGRDELARLAEPVSSSPSLDRLGDLARKRRCALVVGFAESRGEKLFNSAALLLPGGARECYRKAHLFGAENLFFTQGDTPFAVHEYAGVKIGLMICFDWYFPEAMRVLALKGAQIVCHPSNFILPWGPDAMVIRCLENRVFAVVANRYGTETRGEHSFTFIGRSRMISPRGEVLAEAPVGGDSVVAVDIDPAKALDKNINKYNDLFMQRRVDFYGDITR